MGEERNYTPLLPFSDLIQDGFIIYDNTVYRRDINLTDSGICVKNSKNMIKYYTTKSTPEPIKLGGD